ncbi:MAG: HAMP domain-containing sensor histidine kinase [Patescibacteria group bacterium]|nr:HAMP domain-containing sensor histidine kinase [Patescibacteria group bacterium]
MKTKIIAKTNKKLEESDSSKPSEVGKVSTDKYLELEKKIQKLENLNQRLKLDNQKLKVTNEAKSEFISIASHQLRTPLTSIKGFTSLLTEGAYGKLSHEKKEVLDKIYVSNERLITLVDNLLNIARIERGKMEYDFQKIDVRDLVGNIVKVMRIQAKSKKLFLKLENKIKSELLIEVDRNKITEAIGNLVDNSIKYTEEGGITITLEKKSRFIKVAVSDTGIGIELDEVPKLFEKFSRGKEIHKLYTEGTGLGLFITKKIVEAHNGKVSVKSSGKEKGSTFFIELPIKQKSNKK